VPKAEAATSMSSNSLTEPVASRITFYPAPQTREMTWILADFSTPQYKVGLTEYCHLPYPPKNRTTKFSSRPEILCSAVVLIFV
jgi:hypothetical protein